MANIKSAKKRVLITRVRTARNAAYKSMMKTAIRRFETSLKDANIDSAKESLQKAIRIIDKLVTKGIIHKNMAARKKSQLARKYNQAAS